MSTKKRTQTPKIQNPYAESMFFIPRTRVAKLVKEIQRINTDDEQLSEFLDLKKRIEQFKGKSNEDLTVEEQKTKKGLLQQKKSINPFIPTIASCNNTVLAVLLNRVIRDYLLEYYFHGEQTNYSVLLHRCHGEAITSPDTNLDFTGNINDMYNELCNRSDSDDYVCLTNLDVLDIQKRMYGLICAILSICHCLQKGLKKSVGMQIFESALMALHHSLLFRYDFSDAPLDEIKADVKCYQEIEKQIKSINSEKRKERQSQKEAALEPAVPEPVVEEVVTPPAPVVAPVAPTTKPKKTRSTRKH